MLDYFEPWRRKLGVATLLMACVLTCGWMRSMFADDVIYVKTSAFHYEFACSRRHGLLFMHNLNADPSYLMKVEFGRISLATSGNNLRFPESEWKSFSAYWIGFIRRPIPSTASGFWLFLPYWSIVMPLTLLSARLLFSKPGVKPKTSTPTSP